MLKIKYVGGRDGVYLVLDGKPHTVMRGETIDVSEEQAVQFLAGPWDPDDKATTTWLKDLEKLAEANEAADAAESEA